MPTKVFTLTGGGCPFGKGCEIDSPACRQCQWFYRKGTYTFIWCLHPKQERANEKAKQIKIGTTPKKRGRPKKAK